MIDISPEKVMHVALLAREFDGQVASWEEPQNDRPPEETEAVLEDFGDEVENEAQIELGEFIDGLNIDEQEALVALTWIGRGTYSAKDYPKALETARLEHINKTRDYLLGIPLLSDYLKEGLSQMGYKVEEIEEDIIRRAPDWRGKE